MSSLGRLHLMLDGDNDVIVSIQEQIDGDLIGNSNNIEFCTIGIGGGGSPRTYKALRELMIAMDEDNKDPNQQSRALACEEHF